ncbi:MAG: RNHCP domain-containing protein [Ruminococcaceae bacterium]|nr:RNHCP domain-containing protein [Oscillospiraceae bacterium]
MSQKRENTAFVCENCGAYVQPLAGSYRNHCPKCLCSKHVDIMPGDRANDCHGIMDPVDVVYNTKKGYQIVHKCRECGGISRNTADLDGETPDSLELLMKIMNFGAQN